MASLWFVFSVRDHSTIGQGAPVSGLNPSWTLFKSLDTGADFSPRPTILEVGQGIYKYPHDAEASGDAVGQIDVLGGTSAPATLTTHVLNPADRYLDQFITRDRSRLITAFNPSGQVNLAPGGLDAVPIETGINARQALAPILAASAGSISGAGTGSIVITGGGTTLTRITAQTDPSGNRSTVHLNLPPAQLETNPISPALLSSPYFAITYFPADYFPTGLPPHP